MTKKLGRAALIAAATVAAFAMPTNAADDPVNDLAAAICGAPDLTALMNVLGAQTGEDALDADQIAEAFGAATFLGDLGRCANRQVIADGLAYFKKGKDVARIDAAFAMGRVAAKPSAEVGGAADAEASYQGSFVALGTAGDPPSSQ